VSKAHKAISKAGREALLCRNASTNDPAALPILKKLIAEGRLLQGVRDQLGKLISLSIDVPLETLGRTIAALRSGGLFAIFSRRFRDARQIALSLLLMDRYEKRDALARLEALFAYRTRERNFEQNAQAISAFGLHFRGTDTNFSPFEALTEYLEFVQTLSGHSLKGLRNFLRDAEWDELEAVPSIPALTPVDTIATLQKDLAEAEVEIESRTSAIAELRPYLGLFREPASIGSQALAGLADRLGALLSDRSSLDHDQNAASVLQGRFLGHRTEVGGLIAACEWALAAAPIAEALAGVIRAGLAKEAAAQIERVGEWQAQTNRLLADLSETARVPSNVFTQGRDELAAARALEAAAQDAEGLFAHAALATAIDDGLPL
jgi:hypothetical protein